MRGKTLALLLMCAASAVCAFSQDVRYNFDKEKDFSKFRTYKWVHIGDGETLNPLVVKQVMAAVDAQLATKGLTKTESDPADLYIGYQAAIGQERQFTSYSNDWGYGGGWYRGGWYGGTTTYGETTTIHTGQLALDMYDTSDHSLAWRGLVSKTLDPKAKPEKQEKNLNKAVTKLLKNYPPKAKK